MLNRTTKIHRLLLQSKKTVSVAESCTGGLLSFSLTQNPGSSGYFMLGVVTYSNQAKTGILKISSSLIKKEGAVSRSVACQMAKSIRKIAKTNFGLGITGIAGPDGATPKKPVGTVFVALDYKSKTICKKFIFQGSRKNVQKQSSQAALKLLYQALRQ